MLWNPAMASSSSSVDNSAAASALPTAVRRVALLLHGRLGIWKVKASHIDDPEVIWKANAPERWREAPKSMSKIDIQPHSTITGFAAFGRASLWRHVIEPNQRAGVAVDCFLHSWHPEIGKQLDALYMPIGSLHEPLERRLNAVQSQHLSMKRAIMLADSHGAKMAMNGADGSAAGRADPSLYYDLYMVVRYDVLFFRTLLFAPLGAAPLWLPHWCHRYPLTAESGMLVRSACGNWPGRGEGYLVHPATVTGIHPPLGKPESSLTREANFDYAYLDWWFVATPRVARTFGHIYDHYNAYNAALQRVAKFPAWTHFFWGHHINKKLRMRHTLRYILYEGVDFRLARHWHLGTHCVHHLGSGAGDDGELLVESRRHLAEGHPPNPADVEAAARSLMVSSAPGGTLNALAGVGIDVSVFYRRVGQTGGKRSHNNHHKAANASLAAWARQAAANGPAQLARQCPVDGRVRLYCPWTSPVCPPSLRASILDIEAAAKVALDATTRMPAWSLHGNLEDIDEFRREMGARRSALMGGDDGLVPNASRARR